VSIKLGFLQIDFNYNNFTIKAVKTADH